MLYFTPFPSPRQCKRPLFQKKEAPTTYAGISLNGCRVSIGSCPTRNDEPPPLLTEQWGSVTERTREIGLKIAIGAQQSRIRWQFLTEAAVLTSMGGILGVATGIGLAEMMSHIMGTPVAISVPACIIAVAFSMVIGVVFGLVPAVKASKLNPIEALRRE